MAWHDNLQHPKARDEAGFIVREFAEHNIDIGGVATEDGGIAFMYAEDQILAREQYLGGVEGIRGIQRIQSREQAKRSTGRTPGSRCRECRGQASCQGHHAPPLEP